MEDMAVKKAAEAAIEAVGLGFDLVVDLSLKYCKKNSSRLILMDDEKVRDLVIPGGFSLRNVPKFIKCDKGERMRFSSDVLSFQQVSFASYLIMPLINQLTLSNN